MTSELLAISVLSGVCLLLATFLIVALCSRRWWRVFADVRGREITSRECALTDARNGQSRLLSSLQEAQTKIKMLEYELNVTRTGSTERLRRIGELLK